MKRAYDLDGLVLYSVFGNGQNELERYEETKSVIKANARATMGLHTSLVIRILTHTKERIGAFPWVRLRVEKCDLSIELKLSHEMLAHVLLLALLFRVLPGTQSVAFLSQPSVFIL